MLLPLQIAGNLVALLLIVGMLLRWADILYDRSDKERLKERVVEFWIRTSNLEFVDRLHDALQSRFVRMRALRWRFLKLFWLLCALLALIVTIEIIWKGGSGARAELQQLIALDFKTRYDLQCGTIIKDQPNVNSDTKCNFDSPDTPPQLSVLKTTAAQFKEYVDKLNPALVIAYAAVGQITGLIMIMIPLSLALVISFNITLLTLAKITLSRLKLVLIIFSDLSIAIFMPPLLTSMVCVVLVGSMVMSFGQIISFSSFGSANWASIIFGMAFLSIQIKFLLPSLVFLMASFLPGAFGWSVVVATILVLGIYLAMELALEFAVDLGKLAGLDFSIDPVQSAINWAIVTDILFSAFYIGPCILLVLANRSERTRHAFLNLVMWVGDHSKGPFYALSELFSLIGALFRPSKHVGTGE